MKSTISSSEWLSEPDVHEGNVNIDQSFPHPNVQLTYERQTRTIAPTVVARLVHKSALGLTSRTFH